ncbi:two-component sensor histidine kinase [Mycobacterium colombiense]|uniref:Sensor histidine kinase MtrB n=2 Tax=Mycobacterium colombiense TaxID=339268 RepID=A0A1A3F114_9MYCO|nr:two-component sensor histidine kinase [Mycobacterium colombiense]OBJ17160.1 two-component sensor histidine kinase [Mycobacterium colombiense]OBJ20254.1 two-component sensor histidine kinase [Mycobacterium colombiense]OBJ26466.1 two-component sensor histidine kinase [Mycobacterium colombiense]OBJ64117.1 two-component sensor histidine kinase [Mycobacterium colombiense]
MTRGMGAVSRAVAIAWRRSLQLRVVALTLGLSLAVILALGFVLTSQVTNRVLDVKVKAAIEQIERARTTVGGIVNGEEARSLDSSLQLARNTLTSKTDPASGAGMAGAFDAVLMVPGDGPRAATTAGPVDQVPSSLRGFVKAGQAAYQYAAVHTDGFSGPALIVGTPASSQVANLELYLIFPLKNEQATIQLVRGTMITGGAVLLVLLAGIALLVSRQVVVPVRSASRIAERFAEGHLSERMPVRGEDDMARLAMSFNDMAESLSRQITQLEEFGNLQRRFTSDVSHELRTPLTTVRMAADLIYDHSADLDPTLARSTELMVNELDRFESLLNDLLEISRHDAGVAELSVEAVDLRTTVQSALGNVGHLAEDARIKLLVDLPAEEVIAEVDTRRVERILRNLIANAIDHAERKPVQIRMGADEDTVAVTVRDYGVGLRPGEEKLVFSRFWRADPSRVRRSGGTGLGLAISIEDARLHQGRLEAWGEPGHGSCFRLTLPLVRGHKVTTSPLPMKPIPPTAATGPQHAKDRPRQHEHAERSL